MNSDMGYSSLGGGRPVRRGSLYRLPRELLITSAILTSFAIGVASLGEVVLQHLSSLSLRCRRAYGSAHVRGGATITVALRVAIKATLGK